MTRLACAAAAALALAALSAAAPALAQAPTPFDKTFGDVKFLDAYFGRADHKMEVRPGDSNVPLTVAMANVGSEDITGVRGQLSLPLGLHAPGGASKAVLSEAGGNPLAGDIFYLTFFVDIDAQAAIGEHSAAARIDYSRLRESGERSDHVEFDFEITGDSVINVRALNTFLTSLVENTAVIEVQNTGTAAVSDVRVSVRQSDAASAQQAMASNIENVVIRETSWDLGNIRPSSVRPLVATIYVPSNLSGDVLRVPLEVTYLNAQGDEVSALRIADFYVRGLIDVRVYDVGVIDLAGRQAIVGSVINEGNEDALFGFVTLEPLAGSNLSPVTQFIDEIETDSPVPFSVFAEFDGEPRYGEHDVRVSVRYKDSTREESTLVHDATVLIPPPERGAGDGGMQPALLLLLAAPAAAAALYVRRRRARRDDQ